MSEPLIRRINREQMCWRAVDVEQLIGEDHLVRAIWDLVGRLHLDGFYQGIDCSEEEGGRPAYDPRLLISLWIYAYSQGMGSAREVARRCEWEPGLQWLRSEEHTSELQSPIDISYAVCCLKKKKKTMLYATKHNDPLQTQHEMDLRQA